MIQKFETENTERENYENVKAKVRPFASMLNILDKVEGDNTLSILSSTLDLIMNKEMKFAVSGKIKRNC